MAGGYLILCAGSLGACAMVASSGRASAHTAGWATRSFQRRLRELWLVLGGSAIGVALRQNPSWRAAADEVVRRVRRRGIITGRSEAVGILMLAAVLASLVLAVLARSLIGALVGVVGMAMAVPLWDSSRRHARERALIDEMPGVFRTLAMALGSGETLTQAIEYVGVHERGYAGEAFMNAALRLRCGASTEEAMNELASELDAPGVGLLTTALVIAQRTGSPLRGLFQSSAQLVERQGEYERMLAVKTAQVRLSVRIVCLLPLLLVAVLSLISIDFQQGLGTPAGMLSIGMAAVMDGMALLIIRRLMRGVL